MRDFEEIHRPYSARGQAIATPACYASVSGDPVSANNGLFYFHSDHLGSATFLTHGNGHTSEGSKVANSTKFYTPFGEYRIQPPSPTDDITDDSSQTTFTGHKHNDYIKMIYMGARYYLPNTNRFLTPDTIVPDQTDPQSFNRYSYTLNNPVKYVDPTGHYAVDGSDATYDCTNTLDCQWTSEYGDEDYHPCHNSLDCVYPDNFEYAGYYILESPYDATVLGATANVKQTKIGTLTIGAEAVINHETNEFSTFFIISGNIGKTVGSSANMFFYGGGAGNLEDGNYNYRGPFQSVSASGSYSLLGAGGGHSWVPGDDLFSPEQPYSDVVGWAPGLGTGVSYSQSEYIPLLTTNWETGAMSVDFVSYAQEKWVQFQTQVASDWNFWSSLWD